MSMFSIWNVQGIQNHYNPMPIKEPIPISIIGEDEDKEDSNERRSSEAWAKVKKKREEKVERKKRKFSHQKSESLLVEDVMQFPVRSLNIGDSWKSAWDLVTKQNVSHIPILSAEKKLVGILSEKDLLRVRLKSMNMLSTDDNPPISSFMKSNVISALPSISIRNVASVMFQEHIGAMPVIDDHSMLMGIVTMKDILKKLVKHTPIKMWSYD